MQHEPTFYRIWTGTEWVFVPMDGDDHPEWARSEEKSARTFWAVYLIYGALICGALLWLN